MRSRMRSVAVVALALLAGSGSAAAGESKDLPANQWAVLHDAPPGVIAIHAKLEWMPALKKGFMWPSLHYASRQANFE